MDYISCNSGYLHPDQMDPSDIGKEAALWIPEAILDKKPMIVGTGLSGALGAISLACHLSLPVGFIRKSLEGSHASKYAELPRILKSTPWIIVDDFKCTGDTISRIKEQMDMVRLLNDYQGEFLGVYLYAYKVWLPKDHFSIR